MILKYQDNSTDVVAEWRSVLHTNVSRQIEQSQRATPDKVISMADKKHNEGNENSLEIKSSEPFWTDVSPNKVGRMGDSKNAMAEMNNKSSISISPSRFSVLHEVEEGEIPGDPQETAEINEDPNEKYCCRRECASVTTSSKY